MCLLLSNDAKRATFKTCRKDLICNKNVDGHFRKSYSIPFIYIVLEKNEGISFIYSYYLDGKAHSHNE